MKHYLHPPHPIAIPIPNHPIELKHFSAFAQDKKCILLFLGLYMIKNQNFISKDIIYSPFVDVLYTYKRVTLYREAPQ